MQLAERWGRACDFLEEDIASGYVRVAQELIAANDAPLVSFDSAYRLTAEGVFQADVSEVYPLEQVSAAVYPTSILTIL